MTKELVYIAIIVTVLGLGFWSGVLFYIPGT